jgi:NAD(P)-dependent dehydrogenase (short-subunit alcohol dehydrogenase family)
MLICDVTDDASVQKMVDEVLSKAGRIDLLVNNSGIGLLGGAQESSTAQAQALFGHVPRDFACSPRHFLVRVAAQK